MFKSVEEIKNHYNIDFYENNNNYIYTDVILKIYNNQINKLTQMELNDYIILNYIGFYYHTIRDYNMMKKYYMMSIAKGNIASMYNMGYYYQYIEKDYQEMKKYYNMAIMNGCSGSMNNIGYYYQHIENRYEEMKKYYMMAIEKGNTNSMNNMGYYYYLINDYDMMKKYFKMAIDMGCTRTMYNMWYYYKNIEKNYFEMAKYYPINWN